MHLLGLLISFALLIIAMSVHEFSHAYVAYRLGDTTAKYAGRLTLNPLAHIDPVGTILLPIILYITTGGRFVFGAARPVPINYNLLKNPKRDVIWVGLAGPLSNIIFAFVLSIALRTIADSTILAAILKNLIIINLILGIFNLIPIPPLDGSRIVLGLLPQGLAYRYISIEPFGFFIVIILIGLGLFETIVWPAVKALLNLLGVVY